MGLFGNKILTKKRVKAVNDFRKRAIQALKELAKKEKDENTRFLYERMIENVENTPVVFYPRKSLRETVFTVGGRVFSSVTRGENVNVIKIIQRGNQRFILRSNYINLPAEHLFEGNSLTIEGIFTLAHEYAPFPKPALHLFARAHGLRLKQAEELLADMLAAKLAAKMGFKKENILGHFAGREIVYGSFPFYDFIERAVK